VSQLAGDYLSSSNVNTATAAGERAARELGAVLAQRTASVTTRFAGVSERGISTPGPPQL
jgi:hypothetical protein